MAELNGICARISFYEKLASERDEYFRGGLALPGWQMGVDMSGPVPAYHGHWNRLAAVEEEVIAQCICKHKVEILQIRHELIKEK